MSRQKEDGEGGEGKDDGNDKKMLVSAEPAKRARHKKAKHEKRMLFKYTKNHLYVGEMLFIYFFSVGIQ
jgi:hypothetical protein